MSTNKSRRNAWYLLAAAALSVAAGAVVYTLFRNRNTDSEVLDNLVQQASIAQTIPTSSDATGKTYALSDTELKSSEPRSLTQIANSAQGISPDPKIDYKKFIGSLDLIPELFEGNIDINLGDYQREIARVDDNRQPTLVVFKDKQGRVVYEQDLNCVSGACDNYFVYNHDGTLRETKTIASTERFNEATKQSDPGSWGSRAIYADGCDSSHRSSCDELYRVYWDNTGMHPNKREINESGFSSYEKWWTGEDGTNFGYERKEIYQEKDGVSQTLVYNSPDAKDPASITDTKHMTLSFVNKAGEKKEFWFNESTYYNNGDSTPSSMKYNGAFFGYVELNINKEGIVEHVDLDYQGPVGWGCKGKPFKDVHDIIMGQANQYYQAMVDRTNTD
ncbi:MAG: hypothetical protein ABIJ08_07325 [Nanoarchaeota archaeon]